MTKAGQKHCQYAQISDVGCVRELNEDSIFCDQSLWLVADGMGGHACGEVASQMAASVISQKYNENKDLTGAIQLAHESIVKAGEEGQGQSGMGTTVVALADHGSEFEIAWVGDSRAYLWEQKRKRLTLMTEDHSLIVRLVNAGLISADDAKKHPQRHMITQCLGSVEISSVKVDTLGGAWLPEQSFMLCSDGLSDDVSEANITRVLSSDAKQEEKLGELVELAKAAGGKDNISIILIDSPVEANDSLWDKFRSYFKR